MTEKEKALAKIDAAFQNSWVKDEPKPIQRIYSFPILKIIDKREYLNNLDKALSSGSDLDNINPEDEIMKGVMEI